MAQTVLPSDLYVAGALTSQTFSPPAGSISDAAVAAPSPPSAAVKATKLQQQYEPTYKQASATTAVSDQQVLHVVRGTTATIIDYEAGCVVANIGAATVTVDLLVNGTTVLSSTISLSSSQTAYQVVTAAGFTSTAMVAGNVLETKITATAGGGTLGKGVFVSLRLREDPS